MNSSLPIRPINSAEYGTTLPYFEMMLRQSGRDGDPHFTFNRDRNVYDTERTDGIRAKLALPLERPGWMRLWVAYDGDAPVANIDFRAYDDAFSTYRAELGVGILRAYRGQGLGRALMLHAMGWAKTAGLDWIDLRVFAVNERAIALYKSLGFQQIGFITDRFRIEGESIDEVMMTYDLR